LDRLVNNETLRAEIEQAFADYQVRVEQIRSSGDWARFADLFTEDATYLEHAFGEFRGRDQIRAWVVKTMGSFPGSTMSGFPPAWHVIDVSTRRVICEIRNLMPDPGDGSALEASNITILTYGGDGLWSREEDVYNPMKFAELSTMWARVAAQHERLSTEGQAFLARMGG
jgi:hypothetical protein